MTGDIDVVLPYVKTKGVCVQAGGNVGVWPKKLSKIFDVVYTFEPDVENFQCLVTNVPEPNVVKFQAALGKSHEMVQVTAPEGPENCGAYQVIQGGYIPTLKIDDLNLPRCDLIYLDIEGFEYFAIEGGLETIQKFKPVIAYEDKPLMGENYGIAVGELRYFLEDFGYKLEKQFHRDWLLVPS